MKYVQSAIRVIAVRQICKVPNYGLSDFVQSLTAEHLLQDGL